MVASVSDKTLVPVPMDLVAHCVKIGHVQYIVKMEEYSLCPQINVNVETDSMDHDATNCKEPILNKSNNTTLINILIHSSTLSGGALSVPYFLKLMIS